MPLPDLNRPRKVAIRKLASRVCEQFWRRHKDVGRLPIRPELIAADEGIPVGLEVHPDRVGWIEQKAGKFRIFVNPEDAPVGSARFRFTLAHELGHYFITSHYYDLTAGRTPSYHLAPKSLATLVPEQEANYFASVLLMPDELFLPALGMDTLGVGEIKEIAKYFQVSLRSAAIRCVEASHTPCAVVVFDTTMVEPWVAVSEPIKKFGVFRDTKLKVGVFPRRATHAYSYLADWFHIPHSKSCPVTPATATLEDNGLLVFLCCHPSNH